MMPCRAGCSMWASICTTSNWSPECAREGEARTAEGGAVQLMTVHAAKGLEFPVVILGDANSPPVVNRNRLLLDDTLGVVLKVTDDKERLAAIWQIAKRDDEAMDEAEAKRVLDVAGTRAEELLIVSGTMSRNRPESGSWLKQLWTAAETGCDSGPETAADAESPSPGGWLIGGHPSAVTYNRRKKKRRMQGPPPHPPASRPAPAPSAHLWRPWLNPSLLRLPPAKKSPRFGASRGPGEPKRRPPHWWSAGWCRRVWPAGFRPAGAGRPAALPGRRVRSA